MASSEIPIDPRRQQQRCSVDCYQQVPGQFITGPVDAPIVLPCKLADLSVGGCAVRLETTLRSEPKIAIVRFDLESDLHLESAGRICWSKQASIGCQSYGLRFRRPLSEDFIGQWIQRGVINRRENQRDKTHQPVQMRTSSNGGSLSDATILDYSISGIRIQTNVPLAIDERILLTLPDGRGVVLGVVWTAIRNGHAYAGAQFANRASSSTTKDFFENHYRPQAPDAAGVVDFFKRCLTKTPVPNH